MNYAGIIYDDVANGPGVRVTLFVQGCNHHCHKCHNPETWNPLDGKPFTDKEANDILDYIENTPFVQGLTLSGGDPLYLDNESGVLNLIKKFRDKFGSSKDIWLYTGYKWEELMNYLAVFEECHLLDILSMIDVLVDGPFIEDLKDSSLEFRGSTNQRLINTFKSLETNNIEIWNQIKEN